jgi:tetratricopeptide (TPR) repeat protein
MLHALANFNRHFGVTNAVLLYSEPPLFVLLVTFAMTLNSTSTKENKTLGVALYLRGKAYLNSNLTSNAMQDLAAAVTLHPELLPAQLELARAYLLCWRSAKAVTHFRQAFAVEPSLRETYQKEYAEALNRWGNALNSSSDYTQAIVVLQEALDVNPELGQATLTKLADSYISCGCQHDKKRDYATAAADFETALKLIPDYALAWRNRGLMYQQLKRYHAAIDDFTESLRL